MPSNSIMRLRFRPKFDFTVMAQNHGVDHLGSTLWTMGSHWVQKRVKTVKKYHDSNFRLPAVIDFGQNSTLRLWRQIMVGTNLGPMGFHWVQKMGHHGKKITIPQNSNFRLPRGHRFRPKFEFTVKSRCRPPSVHFVPIGSKEWVKTVKNYHALKFDYATTPRSSISNKIRLYGYGAK